METKENKYRKGQRFSAKIHGVRANGKIQIQGSTVYLCQNEASGDPCTDKLGYDFSWNVGDGSDERLEANNVVDLVLGFDGKLCEGDIVVDHAKIEYIVGGVCGKVVFLLRGDTVALYGTNESIKRLGYKLKEDVEEKIVELTIEDISSGKGVGVAPHLIRIKKGK